VVITANSWTFVKIIRVFSFGEWAGARPSGRFTVGSFLALGEFRNVTGPREAEAA